MGILCRLCSVAVDENADRDEFSRRVMLLVAATSYVAFCARNVVTPVYMR